MRGLLDEYPYSIRPRQNRKNNLAVIEDYLSRFYGRSALVLASARTGLYAIYKFLGLNRSDHILMPDFMCQAVLNITNTSGFPVKRADEKTKAVLVFHQWGYPQKMDEVITEAKKRNLIVIEDCAHSFNSSYKGRKIGTFGKAAIFSFAKLFPTYLGGVLVSGNAGLIDYVKKDRAQKDKFVNRLFNFIAGRIAKKSFEKGKARFWLDIIYLKSIHYPNLGRKYLRYLPGDLQSFETELAARKQNYQFLKSALKKELLIPDWDADIDPDPFLIPVFLPEQKLMSCREALLRKGIFTEILHFDINRNLFAPDYRKSLAIPCHQMMERRGLEKMAEVINQA